MARRQPYSLVLIGARKEEARKKYLDFLAGRADRPTKIGTQGERSPIITLALEPFSIALPTAVQVAGSATTKALLALQGFTEYAARVKLADDAPSGSGISIAAAAETVTTLPIGGGFTPARVIRKVYSGNATPKKSEITGLMYARRASETISAAFGQKAAADTMAVAMSELEDQLKTTVNTRVYFRSEIAS
jgi:hypothetical protein